MVIPAYNAEKTIRECVGSVLDNDYDDFEVIVVEDNSIDRTKKILESITDGRIKLFFNKTNSGASFSRNEGIKRSLGDVVLLLDSDSYVGEDWIRRHVKLHE